MRFALALILMCWSWACGSPCQQMKATRCNGSVVEACGSNRRWQRVLDCAQVKSIKHDAPKVWKCDETAKGCTCVPVP